MSGITAIAAGAYYSVALLNDGTVRVWGSNTNGQFGNGTTTSSSSPVALALARPVTAIGAGATFTLLVLDDGTVWGAGANGGGQLGDGTTTQRLTPVQMSGIANAVAVAGGTSTSLVLLSDGTLRGCGGNGTGMIGDGTTTQRTTPVAPTGLSGVLEVVARNDHVLARRDDGSVWAWGGNSDGELGLGDTSARHVPTQIPGLSSAALVGVTTDSSFMMTADDAPPGANSTLWAWGGNSHWQLGDGTRDARLSPNAITGPDFSTRTATPYFGVSSGTYSTELSVSISSVTGTASIHYTTNGNDPTLADPTIANGGSIAVDQTLTVKARAFATDLPDSNVGIRQLHPCRGDSHVQPVRRDVQQPADGQHEHDLQWRGDSLHDGWFHADGRVACVLVAAVADNQHDAQSRRDTVRLVLERGSIRDVHAAIWDRRSSGSQSDGRHVPGTGYRLTDRRQRRDDSVHHERDGSEREFDDLQRPADVHGHHDVEGQGVSP